MIQSSNIAAQQKRRGAINDQRFTRPLFTVAGAARLVGMSPSTLHSWAKGCEKSASKNGQSKQKPIITTITTLKTSSKNPRSIPFIGLVEATVVQAFRNTGLPMQRIRKALDVLANQGELKHALASKQLYSDGANVLYEYATKCADKQLRLLTVVHTGQQVFHDVIAEYLERITFSDKDKWATELVLPITDRPLLRVIPDIAGGNAVFVQSGVPLSAITSRASAGESLNSIAKDFDMSAEDIKEALDAIYPSQAAA